MKHEVNKSIAISSTRFLIAGLLGGVFYILFGFILTEIGPQPGGIVGVLRAPGLYGFCPYLGPTFNMIYITLYAASMLSGFYLGLVFRNKFKNLSKEDGNKFRMFFRMFCITTIITFIIYTGVLMVWYIFGFGLNIIPYLEYRLEAIIAVALGSAISIIISMITFRQWINKIMNL